MIPEAIASIAQISTSSTLIYKSYLTLEWFGTFRILAKSEYL